MVLATCSVCVRHGTDVELTSDTNTAFKVIFEHTLCKATLLLLSPYKRLVDKRKLDSTHLSRYPSLTKELLLVAIEYDV